MTNTYTLDPKNVARLERWAKARRVSPEAYLNLLVFRHCSRLPSNGGRRDGKLRLNQVVFDGGDLPLTHEQAAEKYNIPLPVFKARLTKGLLGDALFAPYP